jgi:hypothetical protein
MKRSLFPALAATAAVSRVAVALWDPRVQSAPVERMRLQQVGSRFLETPLESASPRQQKKFAQREPGFGSLDQHSQESREAVHSG